MSAAVLKPIHRIRLKNLKALIDARFKGNSSECARAIKRSHTFMWQLVTGYRGIGEASARHIEKRLELGANALDASFQRSTTLTAHLGGGTVQNYRMVPLLTLASLKAFEAAEAKPKEFRPCPTTDCGERVFCAVVEDASGMAELEAGDVIFVDAADFEPRARGLYLVTQQDWLAVMLAKKRGSRWLVTTTEEGKREEHDWEDCGVRGRVILIVRVAK